jgi:hypothetical protein
MIVDSAASAAHVDNLMVSLSKPIIQLALNYRLPTGYPHSLG